MNVNRFQPLLLCTLGAMVFSACGKDNDSTDTGLTDSENLPIEDDVTLEIAQGPISVENEDLGAFPGWIGVPNLDDDNEDGSDDWSDLSNSVDNDLATGWLTTHGRDVALTLSGQTEQIRIYQGGALILGEGSESTHTVAGSSDPIELELEFEGFLNKGQLTVQDTERDIAFTVALTSSPLILNHHLQPAEEVMAMEYAFSDLSNTKMIRAYTQKLGESRFINANYNKYDGDPWLQDEFEFGYMNAPDMRMDFIFDTLRNGQGRPGSGLDNFPEDQYESPDWAIGWWGQGRANSQDYGGNLEVSPPVEVNGVQYPYGRIYYGGKAGFMPKEKTRQALDDMRIQKPFMVDPSWLCVGHVDEYSTTIPDPDAPKGFRFVLADTHSAWELLDTMDPTTALPRYRGSSGHYIKNIGEIVNDSGLRSLNEEIQAILDIEKAKFITELGLTEEDIVYLPSLFEEPNGCGNNVASLIPGMVNLIVAEEENGQPAIFLADPFMRSKVNDQSTDPFIAAVREIFPPSLNLHFVDDWDLYHMALGEVHCGSNVRRSGDSRWWEDATHLLEDEQ